MNFDEIFGKLFYFACSSYSLNCVKAVVSAIAEKGLKGFVSVRPLINGVEAVTKYVMYFCSPDNVEMTFKFITDSRSYIDGTKVFSFESFLSPTPQSEVL